MTLKLTRYMRHPQHPSVITENHRESQSKTLSLLDGGKHIKNSLFFSVAAHLYQLTPGLIRC